MLFQFTHTHTNATCPAAVPDAGVRVREWWKALQSNDAVKVHSAYASPTDHVFHITLEADDMAALTQALLALNPLGSGSLDPVMPFEAMFGEAHG